MYRSAYVRAVKSAGPSTIGPRSSTITYEGVAMADSVLKQLSAANIFDLRGVIAVVTGGGTVCIDIVQ